ncbi:UDP-N-acetylglucosamine--undecaprenyl-phosphate N-acetylglucosaminephosphotransferase [Shewanella sp. 6_MG-2023]|uniref:UDP-N-acetylglucosamine--undecaprenyl-phosphate N-acetylglucosaminephosphotransferase n=1 Tax=Shewanella sp. 6_MG-2023 TaxID=3062660 RepID=UPI0026E280E4|nr:UDP-N-acetylglucosamine--undecaprenyl-phosphate N-acetylglucosaminephosphotransferase [Shewanella sp. 6_MG-2023]MDO6617596.1 UDP-N-acetylglucosamine--undecaprenyl-phosphate N-acetylglucosaminephosphotransferase [Shewanella sp. 6_MG-2023]
MDFILPLLTSFLFSFVAIRLSKPIAIKAGLVDVPNQRKLHVGAIPLVGGIGIYISILTASMIFIDQSRELNIYHVAAALVLFLGALDDRNDLSVKLRIIAQVIVASLMIFGTELYFTSLGHILGSVELSLGIFGAMFTVIAIIAGINAINMMDGIDGLAGSVSLIACIGLAFLLHRADSYWLLLPVLFISSLMAYLMFNLGWHRSLTKVFMGDAGNMFIGLTIVWLMVVGVEDSEPAFRPVTCLYLIAIPLMDMVAIMFRRIKKGRSPFLADREHLHHIFERAGFSRKQTLLIITSICIVFAIVGCWSEIAQVPEWIMFTMFIGIFLLYNWTLQNIWTVLKKIRQNQA